MKVQRSINLFEEINKIETIMKDLDDDLYQYWNDNFESAGFHLKINIGDTKKLDSLDLRNQFKEKFPTEDVSNLKGIYMIYRNNKLFYIGEGKILSRLRRHCNKPYRTIYTPRIEAFRSLLDDELYVIALKMKNPEHVKQRVMFEMILTGHLLPKYMMEGF